MYWADRVVRYPGVLVPGAGRLISARDLIARSPTLCLELIALYIVPEFSYLVRVDRCPHIAYSLTSCLGLIALSVILELPCLVWSDCYSHGTVHPSVAEEQP